MLSSYISYLDYHKPYDAVSMHEVVERSNDTPKNKNYILKYSQLDTITTECWYNQFEMYSEIMEKYVAAHPPEEIRYLIFTGDNYYTDSGMSVPYYLIGKYGLKNASLIALNQGCSGTPQAIQLADYIVKTEPHSKVLIAALSKVRQLEKRYCWPTITGDGAGIMVVGREGFLKVCDSCGWSDGSASRERCSGPENMKEIDYMSRESLLLRNIKRIVQGLLTRNNLKLNDVDRFIPQNIHYLLYRMYAKSFNVKHERFFLDNIPNGGHWGDVDSIRNLRDVFLQSNEPDGKYLLFTLGDLGDNYSYHAILLEAG